MSRHLLTATVLLLAASAALAQPIYCRQFDNKTYCSGGVIAHRYGSTTVIPNPTPYEPQQPLSVMPQNGVLPRLTLPYSAAGTQDMQAAPMAPGLIQPALPAPDLPAAVLVAPPSGSRVCHQFGTVLVCN